MMVTKKTTTKKPRASTITKVKPKKKLEDTKEIIQAVTPAEELVSQELTETSQAVEIKASSDAVEKYFEAVGRRKEATARVRVYTKKSTDPEPSEEKAIITINSKPYYEYFKAIPLQNIIEAPLKKLKSLNRFKATVKVSGGGAHGQADAVRLGLSRALTLFDINFSKKLRKAGYLTRDSREKERRKYGLKKARKAPQWAKR